jgi:adenosylcobinamide-GDP ribazoletransferase
MHPLIRRESRLFCAALAFFTRLPGVAWAGDKADLGHTARYLPLVGLIVGGIGGLCFWLAHLFWPLPLAMLLSMTATILITGAFHEDGLADSCDAFGGGWSAAQILTIMQDSRLGVYGVLGLGLVLVLKLLALLNLPPAAVPFFLIAGHSLSRFAAVTFFYTHVYVRPEGPSKARPVAPKMSPAALLGASLLTGAVLLLGIAGGAWVGVSAGRFLGPLVPLLGVRWLAGRYFARRLGGYTGDCLGALQQVTELIFYLFAGLSLP